jgi:hypothetical protein
MKELTAEQFKVFLLPAILFCAMLVTSLHGLPLVRERERERERERGREREMRERERQED